jgi:sulfite exporter TauE/SafE
MTEMMIAAVVMGILGSAHCAVMCGAVASTVCARPRASVGFNAGRIATYVGLGAVAGAFGAMVPFFAVALRPVAAIALVGLGLHLAGISSLFTKVERIGLPLWKRLAPLTKKPLHATLLGAIWGFVPCGLVYAALTLAATSGSTLSGTLTMLAFGAGTLPVMAAIATVARGVLRYRRFAGILVLALGIHQTVLAFAAFNPSFGPSPPCHHRHQLLVLG